MARAHGREKACLPGIYLLPRQRGVQDLQVPQYPQIIGFAAEERGLEVLPGGVGVAGLARPWVSRFAPLAAAKNGLWRSPAQVNARIYAPHNPIPRLRFSDNASAIFGSSYRSWTG